MPFFFTPIFKKILDNFNEKAGRIKKICVVLPKWNRALRSYFDILFILKFDNINLQCRYAFWSIYALHFDIVCRKNAPSALAFRIKYLKKKSGKLIWEANFRLCKSYWYTFCPVTGSIDVTIRAQCLSCIAPEGA